MNPIYTKQLTLVISSNSNIVPTYLYVLLPRRTWVNNCQLPFLFHAYIYNRRLGMDTFVGLKSCTPVELKHLPIQILCKHCKTQGIQEPWQLQRIDIE